MSNVPKLRFKEFSGDWENKSLKDLTKINQGLQIPIADRFTEQVENSYFYITNEFLKETSSNKYFIKNHPESVLCTKSDVLMTRTGNTGQVVTNVNGVFHNNFFKIKYSEDLNKDFLVEFLRLRDTQNMIMRYAGTSTIPDLNHGDFYRLKINLPSKQEQEKIASFLTSVDTKIEQLTKKEELIKQYKKGVMQQIFSGEIRFKADNLREGTIKDFGHFYYGKGAPKSSVTENAETPCVRYGELYSTYGELIKTIKSHTNINPKDLKFSKGGEVLVPRVGEDPLDFANCSYLPIEGVAIGEMISVYNTEENGLYMTYCFNTMLTKQFARVVEGGNVSNLYFKYLEDIELTIHSRNEQDKIVDFLQALDTKLEQVSTQLDSTKEFKKALLQQMFV
jgi:type I restriction enzyme S subunit